ncbi:DnaJ sub C member 21 [Gnomoniopsis smithogilvyi]|uniref:DnaJ sub C member 21 n=1 Tax=Gnomoniopsis smithogilvyi TaxID=1191159 RepID=A0A9W8YVQ0_9PEZI|nr:DnaJ sub C member 21 [Gnomoniopsis smithogilvyi]
MEIGCHTFGHARHASRFGAFSRFLSRNMIILLALLFALVLQVGSYGHLLRDVPQTYKFTKSHLSPSTFFSFPHSAGREEVGRCFTFTSRALDHYQVLDLPRDVSQDLIRPAYRTLARVCHPDKLKEEVSWETANANFARLRLAYDTLVEGLSRCVYDCDDLFDIFGRTTREWQRCGECSKLKYWRFMEEAEDDLERAARNKEKSEDEIHSGGGKEEKKPRTRQGQVYEREDDNAAEGGCIPHVHVRAVSKSVWTFVKETGLVLEQYALQVLAETRRYFVSLRLHYG